jgi:hypothetical protein
MKEKKKIIPTQMHQPQNLLTKEEEKFKVEQKHIVDFWKSLPTDKKKKIIRVDKFNLLKEIKENNGHVCSCTLCGRKRAIFGKEIEKRLVEYCKELEYKGTIKKEETLKQKAQIEKLRQQIFHQQSHNRRMILKFNTNHNSFLPSRSEYDENEMSKDDYISYNFSKNLIIDETGLFFNF